MRPETCKVDPCKADVVSDAFDAVDVVFKLLGETAGEKCIFATRSVKFVSTLLESVDPVVDCDTTRLCAMQINITNFYAHTHQTHRRAGALTSSPYIIGIRNIVCAVVQT